MMLQGAGPASAKALGQDKAWQAPGRTVVRKAGGAWCRRALITRGEDSGFCSKCTDNRCRIYVGKGSDPALASRCETSWEWSRKENLEVKSTLRKRERRVT